MPAGAHLCHNALVTSLHCDRIPEMVRLPWLTVAEVFRASLLGSGVALYIMEGVCGGEGMFVTGHPRSTDK